MSNGNSDQKELQDVLDLLEGLRAEAGSLVSEQSTPVVKSSGADVIADYLRESIMSISKQIGSLRDLMARANQLKRQLEVAGDRAISRRAAFINAFVQIDSDAAHEAVDAAQELEESLAERDRGEFADMSVWEAARVVLQRTDREMTTREIVDALKKGGKKLGPKATSSVSAALCQGKAGEVFERVKISGSRQRWALREPDQPSLLEGEENEA